MRIISQNGTIDVPYDMCCVWRQEEVIYCRVVGNDDNILMATYSSSETAEMVLERFKDNALVLLMEKSQKNMLMIFIISFQKRICWLKGLFQKAGNFLCQIF